ncbi:MBL fold metallo-hydrolase [Pyrobaculum neutrophilum]|uniref:Beta-lactamase domain protein n=1 Tax=Pyrobaculum neutrophilum (strain DSM 2338 / JCM 9278 / NBRC 100436 / V24Sta) TaxID=444157 RepID=B1Y8U0_PYRNV|nr:MBL fold metallo-hydrolase [Pyrobaculum neutrophilum]ACB40169.1 beta-lactamase domain protein [Pyrobaculum neutrophilum V24Sta]
MELRKGIKLLRGSPNTLIAGVYVVDPGQPETRALEIVSQVGGPPTVLLTHFHADHLSAVPDGSTVYAPWGEELFVASVKARLFLTHGVYVDKAVYKGRDLKVDGVVKAGDRVGPFEVVHLPGHTFGHVGYYADGLLYAGDAIFGEKVLEKYGVPYLMDYSAFLNTLDRILSLEPELLVVGHGPVVGSKKKISELVETNRKAVERAYKLVEAALPGDVLTLAKNLLKRLGVEAGWENLLLTATTVRAVLSHLSAEGRAQPDEFGVWR